MVFSFEKAKATNSLTALTFQFHFIIYLYSDRDLAISLCLTVCLSVSIPYFTPLYFISVVCLLWRGTNNNVFPTLEIQ